MSGCYSTRPVVDYSGQIARASSGGIAVRWPLVGRDQQLEQAVRAVVDGDLDGAVLCGPGGVGRSRLLTEAAARLERRGWRTARLTATPAATSLPLAACTPLLADAGRERTVGATYAVLTERSVEGRFVPVIDDAHWLDDWSIAALQLFRDATQTPLLFTLNDGVAPREELRRLTTGRFAVVDLRPLRSREVDDLLDRALEYPVATAARAELWRLSQGLPAALRAVLEGGLDSGALELRDGLWVSSGSLALTTRARGFADRALAPLSHDARRALETVAVGEPIAPSLLAGIVGSEVLHDLEERGLIHVVQDGARLLTRVPALHREVVLSELTWARRRQLCAALATALEHTGLRRREDRGRWAGWRVVAGATAPPAAALVDAARQSLQDTDRATAVRLARAAATSEGVEPQLVLAEALLNAGEEAGALRAFTAAENCAETDQDRASIAIAKAQHLLLRRHDPADALAVIRHAARRCAAGDQRDRLSAMEAVFLSFVGDLSASLEVTTSILARERGSDLAALSALTVGTFAETMLGRPEQALAGIERGEQLVERVGRRLPLAEAQLGTNRVFALTALARANEAEQFVRHAYARALSSGEHRQRGTWMVALATALIERGAIAEAEHHLVEAIYELERDDPVGVLPAGLALRAYVAALQGEARPAHRTLRVLDRQYGNRHRFIVWRQRAATWLAALEGDRKRLSDAAERAYAHARSHQLELWTVWPLHDLIRLGEPGRARERLKEASSALASPLVTWIREQADALDRDEPRHLETIAERFAAAGFSLYAAEAAAQAANAHQRRGAHRAAARTAARGRRISPDAPTARAGAVVAPPPQLTGRELEVARLAATGLSSQQIADRLVISVRTVDNHLHRVYRKLGISRRAELAKLV
jgi:DNA-binding CsgD family transcriptional regulator